jgi:prepilin peptidase CpaA
MISITQQEVYLASATVAAVAGAIVDVKSRRIPNLLTGPAILAGLVLHAATGGWHGLWTSLLAGLICGVVFLFFYVAGGMGAGDVKLMIAVGVLGGLPHIAYLLALTAIAGGVMGLVLALSRGRLKQTLANVGALAQHHTSAGIAPHPEMNVRNASMLRLPYGLAIAAGCCATLWLQRGGL